MYCMRVCMYICMYVDTHFQPTPINMAWSVRSNGDSSDETDSQGTTSHIDGNHLLATPSSDAVDSSYQRQDGRRNGEYHCLTVMCN